MFTFAFTLLVHQIVHDAKSAHFCLLFILHLDVLQDNLTSVNVTLVPLVLATQEVIPIMLCPLQAFVSRLKSFIIFVFMVLNRMIGLLSDLFGLLLLRVELVDGIEAKVILSLFTYVFILFPVVALSLKLSPALIFDIIDSARVHLRLIQNVFLYCHQCLLGLDR